MISKVKGLMRGCHSTCHTHSCCVANNERCPRVSPTAQSDSTRRHVDQRTPDKSCSSAALGLAPTICFTGLPSWNRMSVGIDMIW